MTDLPMPHAAPGSGDEPFRALVEHVQDIITVMDRDGIIRYESPAVSRVLGYRPEERVGRNAFDLVHPDDVARIRAAFAAAMAAPGARRAASVRIQHRDGTWRELEVVGTNCLDEPSVRGVVINSRDVTERNRMEARLRDAERMESVGRLAGGIAHDFNNLLTVIQGNALILAADLPEASPLRTEAEEIERAARRAAELTRQLLVFSRQQLPQPRPVDLNAEIRQAEWMLRRLLPAEVELVLALEAEPAVTRAEPDPLQQALVALVTNARDGLGGSGRITLGTRNDGPGAGAEWPAVVAYVTAGDAGPADGPFLSARGEAGPTLGAAYATVTEFGGRMRLHTGERGSAVELHLPAVDAVAAPSPAASATILLVEDEAAVRTVARKALERAGYRVLPAADGTEALRLVAEHAGELELVVTDVVMPGMSGPELVTRIRERLPDLRVLFISGYTDEGGVRRGIREGTAELLAKPFSPHELATRVAELLAS